MAFENLFIRTKRTIGSIQLDSVIYEDHSNNVTITKNPVEAGVDITDHAIIQPKVLSLRGVVTDTPLGQAAFGLLIDSITGLFGTSTSDNVTRSQQAYEALILLQENREPIEVSTRLKIYQNMLITNVSTIQDKDSSKAVFLDILLEEIIVTESETSDLTEDDIDADVAKSATPEADRGKQESTDATDSDNKSVLATITDWFGG